MEKEVYLGIDIGGTNTVFGLVDRQGKVFSKKIIATQADKGSSALFRRIFEELEHFLDDSGMSFQILGVGVGAPNGNYYNGTIENPPNLGWKNVDVVRSVQQFLNVPVRVTNDANAAALGEMRFGAAQNMKNFIEVTLGTGLGSGIVVDGNVLYGSDGTAGEMGHITAIPDGRKCNCGRRGCLETYCSAEGLRRTVIELQAEMNGTSSLRDISYNDLTAKQIFQFALQGDAIAQKAFDVTAHILGRALADVSALFSPEAIILFGGLTNAGEILFRPLNKYFELYLMKNFKGKVKLMVSGLKEGEAAILGAAALIWQEL